MVLILFVFKMSFKDVDTSVKTKKINCKNQNFERPLETF